MKILKPLILFLAITTATAFAQTKPFKATSLQNAALKKQAEACAAAMMQQNFKQMAYYTYPAIVQMIGGPDKMAAKITESMQQMQAMGISFKSATIGNVGDIVKSEGDLYSVVQDILQLSNNGTVMTSSSYLLGISHDNGVRWYFVDTTPFKNQNIKKLFPTYPPGFVIPETKNPAMN